MTRRRADTRSPYPGIAAEALTGAQREEVQAAIVEQYLGRLERALWDKDFHRGPRFSGNPPILRIYGTPRRREPPGGWRTR